MPSILDPNWKYVPAAQTDIRDTFRKAGFKPVTQAERKARNNKTAESKAKQPIAKGHLVLLSGPK